MDMGEMRAVVYLGPGQLEMRRLPIPTPAAGEVLVRVRRALTCGTDVKSYRRGHPKFPPPFVFGHEFAGEIVAFGEQVSGFEPGQRVTANVFAECGGCFYCQKRQGNLCENLQYNFGAFAEYMLIPASIVRRNLFIIPSHLPYSQAALLEPLVTVVHGQRVLCIRPGESAAIIGAGGPISLLHLQMARLAGAEPVIAVGHSPARLEAARQLGAHHTINSHEIDPLEAIFDLTGGRGADVALECAGTLPAWETAFQAVRKGGRVLWFGGLPSGTQVALDAGRIHYQEITLYGVHGGTSSDAQQAFELLCSGAVDGAPLISTELPLEQVEQALQAMIAGEIIKAALNPDTSVINLPAINHT
jgi:L-iditol 2-dehydrogenase